MYPPLISLVYIIPFLYETLLKTLHNGKISIGLCSIGGTIMKYKGEAYIVLASLGFSLMPVFAKMAYRNGANVTTVLLFRFIFAFLFIWAYIFINKLNYKLKLKQIGMLFLLGAVFYSGSAISIFNSYRFISAGLSEVLVFTYPAWVLLISFFAFKEKLTKNKIYAIVLSMTGIVLVAYVPNGSFNRVGIIFALAGSVAYALYVSFIDYGDFSDVNSIVMTGYILVFGAVAYLIFGITRQDISIAVKPAAWVYIAMLAFASTSVAILAFCEGAKLIGSSRAAIVSTVEPIGTFACGYIFLGEPVTFNMLIGGIIVIMAILSIHIFKTE